MCCETFRSLNYYDERSFIRHKWQYKKKLHFHIDLNFIFIGREWFFFYFFLFSFCLWEYRFHNCIELNSAFLYIIGPKSNQISMFIPTIRRSVELNIQQAKFKFNYDSNTPEIINKLKCFTDVEWRSQIRILHSNEWKWKEPKSSGLIKSW